MDYRKIIKSIITKTWYTIILFALVILPSDTYLYQLKTNNNYIVVTPRSIGTLTSKLEVKSIYSINPYIKVGNYTFEIENTEISSKSNYYLFGDMLIITNEVTDTIDVYMYDINCIQKIKSISIPLLKDIYVQDGQIMVLTFQEKDKPIPTDIHVPTQENQLTATLITVKPTIDNIYIRPKHIIAITQETTTYTYNGIPLHLNEDIYITSSSVWHTKDHIHYKEIPTNRIFTSKDPVWFTDNMVITATTRGILGPTVNVYTWQDDLWKKKKYYLIFDDPSMALKARKKGNVSIGQTDNTIFIAFSDNSTTIFYKYTLKDRNLEFAGTKVLPDSFTIRGKYAFSIKSGNIVKLGTWTMPLLPSINMVDILLKIPFILTNEYLDNTHIRRCNYE